MSKFVELVKQFNEEQKDLVVLAEKNGAILKSRLEAKIKSLEADLSEKRNDLADAEDRVKQAMAVNTRNVDEWLENVRVAEEDVEDAQNDIKDIEYTISDIEGKIEIFQGE